MDYLNAQVDKKLQLNVDQHHTTYTFPTYKGKTSVSFIEEMLKYIIVTNMSKIEKGIQYFYN